MRLWPMLALIVPLAAGAQTTDYGDYAGTRKHASEAKVPLPAYPKPENYLPFQVSAITPFQFFVDAKSISIGADAVVHYTLIAKSENGASNISFEGMRCADYQYRIYAFGNSDNTWSEARSAEWRAIKSDPRNGQRAVLYTDFFCPYAAPIASAEDGVNALKRGGNSRSGISD